MHNNIENTRWAAKLISEILKDLSQKVEVGMNLLGLEEYAKFLMNKYDVKSYNKGYKPEWALKPYPNILCLSVNHVLNHGVVKDYVLKEGDILTIDLGIIYKDAVGDAAITVPVGKITNKNERLLRYAKKAVYVGIDQIRAGAKVTDIGAAIQLFVERIGKYKVNENLSGHAIGFEMHQKPQVPMHDVTSRLTGEVPILEAGMVLCIEPHITFDTPHAYLDQEDKWSVCTLDKKNAAVFEHMVEVLPDGYNILTNHFRLD